MKWVDLMGCLVNSQSVHRNSLLKHLTRVPCSFAFQHQKNFKQKFIALLKKFKVADEVGKTMVHLHDDVIWLRVPECFEASSVIFPLWRIARISITKIAVKSFLVVVVKWRHHANVNYYFLAERGRGLFSNALGAMEENVGPKMFHGNGVEV